MAKSKSNYKPNPQLLCIFASFSWFATVLELNKDNGEPAPELLKLYKNTAALSICTEDELSKRMDVINSVVKQLPTVEVDYLLLSLSVLSEYYMQTRGSKRLYSPMSHDNILMLQDEVMKDMPKSIWEPTFDFAEQFVTKILKG